MGRSSTADLDELVASRGAALLASARQLAGSRHGGEDLLQATLEKCVRSWHPRGAPEAYVRRAMYNLAVDGWRVRGRRPEVFADVEPEPVQDHAPALVDRHVLLGALGRLPPRQREVLVLRYLEDRSESETAALLGCTVGTVKSTTSRALASLRHEAHLEDADLPTPPPPAPAPGTTGHGARSRGPRGRSRTITTHEGGTR